MVVTLAERKARKIEHHRDAVCEAIDLLRRYGSHHGGRFLIFGSTARGDIRADSDFDVVVDFPASSERITRLYVEELCVRLHLKPDIHLMTEISDDLKIRVFRDGIIVP